MNRISCIILNYNDGETAWSLTEELSESRIITDLILVDNHSSDDSWKMLENKVRSADQTNGPRLHFIRTEENRGYGMGNQAGIDYALDQGAQDYLLIANPDIHVEDRCIRRIIEALEAEKTAAAASAMIHSTEERPLFSYWDLLSLPGDLMDTGLFTRRLFRRYLKTPENRLLAGADPASRIVGAVPGSFFVLKTAAFETEELRQLFDPEVFLYYEEKILGKKLKDRGLKELLVTDVSYIHAHSVSIDKSYRKIADKQRLLHKSKLYYYQTYLKAGPAAMAASRIFLAVVMAEVRFLTEVLGIRW